MEGVISNFCFGQTIIYKSIYNWSHIFFSLPQKQQVEDEGKGRKSLNPTQGDGMDRAYLSKTDLKPTVTLQTHRYHPPNPPLLLATTMTRCGPLARSRAVVAILTVAVLLV
jgi:hypothetical protein